MPTASATSKIRQSRARLAPGARGLELGLEVRAPDGSTILTAGGLWDRDELAYESSGTPHIITLVSSQVRAALQLAQWFLAYERDDPDRQALEVYVDNRRGGKTFFSVLAILLFAIRYPDCHLGKTICWLVVPTFPQQRELHEIIAKVPVILHTPLMSGSNFIHGVVVVGAMVALGHAESTTEQALGFFAVALGAANAAGGYVVTERMLGMFKKKEEA